MSKWIRKTQVYKDLGMTRQAFQHWWTKEAFWRNISKQDSNGSWYVDIESPEYIAWSELHIKTETAIGSIRELSEQAAIAEAKAKIYEAQIKQHKAESSKIDLDKKRGNLIERDS